jgi:hypothetical protein
MADEGRAGAADLFVGRRREVQALDDALEAAMGGRGALLVLLGEPGIGKTHLARHFERSCAQRAISTAWAQCWEWGGAPAFWPWSQVIRKLTAPGRLPSTPPPPASARLLELVPELRAAVGDVEPPPVGDPEQARFLLFHAVVSTLRWLASEGPLLVVLDDVHAADVASLRLLHFAARELGDAPVLLLATARNLATRGGGRDSDVEAELDDLASEWRAIDVPALSLGDVSELIAQTTGSSMERDAIERLHQATGGNALFVDRVSRALELDASSREGGPAWVVPEGLRAAIRARIKPLDAGLRELLETCAVLGRPVSPFLLARVLGTELDRVAVLLGEGERAGLLDHHGELGTAYALRHAVVREAVYGELGTMHRMRMHAAVGIALEQLHGDQHGAHLSELAHHFGEALALDDDCRSKAVDYAARAGDVSMLHLAYEQASTHYAQALRALSGDPARRVQLLLDHGEAELAAAGQARARDSFAIAAERARELGDARALARAALGFGRTGEYGATDDEKLALLEEALGGLDTTEVALAARLRGRMAMELWADPHAGKRRDALSLRALDDARTSADPDVIGFALHARLLARGGPAHVDERLRLGQELVDLANRSANLEWTLEAHRWRLNAQLELGEMDRARESVREYDRAAVALRRPQYHYNVALRDCFAPALRGDFADARARIDAAREAGFRAGDIHADTAWCSGVTFWALVSGRVSEIRDVLPRLAAHAERLPNLTLYQALVVIAQSCSCSPVSAAARRHVDDLGLDDIPQDFFTLPTVALLTHVLSRAPRPRRAAELHARYAGYAQRQVCVGAYLPMGCFSRFLGVLSWLAGAPDRAIQELESAVALDTATGGAPFVVWSKRELAAALRHRGTPGDFERAATLETEVTAEAEALGMGPDRALIDAHSEDAPPTVQRPPVTRDAVETVPERSRPAGLLARENGLWRIELGDEVHHLRDQRGLTYLARLLGTPGTEVHALDLAGSPEAPDGDAGPALDAEAKLAYRRRIVRLREMIDAARAADDPARGARAEAELEFISHELSRATGLGGRNRPTSSASERARSAVTRALRRALAAIRAVSDPLGEHLEHSVKTGTYCAYKPDPRAAPRWTVSP